MAVSSERDVIEICSSSSDDEYGVKQELRIPDGRHFLRKFIDVCEPLLKPDQLKAITKLLFDKFTEANTDYTQSEEFRQCIQQHILELQAKKKSVYVHIQDVKTALMRMSTSRVKLASAKAEIKPSLKPVVKKEPVGKDIDEQDRCGDDAEDEEIRFEDGVSVGLMMTCAAENSEDGGGERVDDKLGSEWENRSLVAGPSSRVNGAEHDIHVSKPKNTDGEKKNTKGKGSKKQIRKLERMLSRLDRAIKRLEERELTLDEMDEGDSTHIQEYQLRRRFVKVYNMLCKLNDCSSFTGRVMEQKIRYEGTRFPEINRRLERLVNQKDFFPDFHDIFTAVRKTNTKKNLGLEKKKLKSIAEEAFEDIGGKLQKRRQQDFILNFSSHSTLNFVAARDAADTDLELKKKLVENRELAKKNLKEVEESFVRRQEEYEKTGVNLEASEHSESDVPSDEASNDEGGDILEPPSKRNKLDQEENPSNDENEKNEREEGEESVDTREKGETDNQVQELDSPCLELSSGTTRPPPVNKQPKTQNIKTNVHVPPQNSIPSSVPYSLPHTNGSSSVISHNNSNSNSLTNDRSENAKQILRLNDNKTSSRLPLVPSTQCSKPRFESHNSTANPVTSPESEMPLVITNVCSLSPKGGFSIQSHNRGMNGQFATLAEVMEGGSGSIVIGSASKQQIMVVKTSKSVQLQTSSPITLKFENSEVNVVSTPSPPPSVTSTQPELDISPDVEEVVMATTQSSLMWYKEERLSTTTAAQPLTQQVSCTQQRVNVSETSKLVRCNQCRQSWRVTPFGKPKHQCARSVRTSCSVPSHSTLSPSRHVVSNSLGHPFLGTQTAQNRVFSLKHTNQIPNRKIGAKWKLEPRASTTITPCAGKQSSTQIPSVTEGDNDSDSDVVIISDSDLEAIPVESPDVICISDSD